MAGWRERELEDAAQSQVKLDQSLTGHLLDPRQVIHTICYHHIQVLIEAIKFPTTLSMVAINFQTGPLQVTLGIFRDDLTAAHIPQIREQIRHGAHRSTGQYLPTKQPKMCSEAHLADTGIAEVF